MDVVELREVTKSFGSVIAVDRLSLRVPQGSVYGFIGPNGSGKTTTLRMIMNIYYPDTGEVRVFGEPPRAWSTDRIGYLPEERGLYRRMRVRDLIVFYGRLKNGHRVEAAADEWLERMGLSRWANRKVEALSKGMSQKVQFIATVVAEPELLILDEPFSGLDPVNAEVLRRAILELRDKGTTVIFSTHDMNVAEQMCDFIFMIHQGRKVLDGRLADIQAEFGADTIRLAVEDGRRRLQGIPGVIELVDRGQVQELRVAHSVDPQDVLREALARARVRRFEVVQPSLHDIFLRIAGDGLVRSGPTAGDTESERPASPGNTSGPEGTSHA
jgi:ABC-2 type transport system ATP-binding protein